MKLWYRQPAEAWTEALPLGNGKMGAMVFGRTADEYVPLNADSVWYGGPVNRNNPDAREFLAEIRELIVARQIGKAEQLAVKALTGVPENQRHYEPMAELAINQEVAETSEYRRELSLHDGVARVQFEAGDSSFCREYLTSAPDQVMAIHLTAGKPGRISCNLRLRRQGLAAIAENVRFPKYMHYYDRVERSGNMLLLHGSGGAEGVRFVCGMTAVVTGGSRRLIGDNLEITDADEATIYITAETTFYHPDPTAAVKSALTRLGREDYKGIRARHIADMQALMKRVELQLPEDAAAADIPTDQRLANVAEGNIDTGLEQLFFDFNRYLLLAASRPGTLPANLQGIWNSQWLPPWDGKYTININAEMNYWPAEPCALSDFHKPLFRFIERLAENGRITARDMYGCRGWCAHHNSDIWADSAPQGTHIPSSYWVMGGAWLSTHLWEHYLFNLDRDFLEWAYPLIKGASEFFLDFLVEDEKGRLVTSPSTSPENTYELPDGTKGCLCQGPSMDSQIIHELFTACTTAAEILEVDNDLSSEIKAARDRLPQPAVGSDGRLLEWSEEYREPEPGHRHISHLWALYPGHRIQPGKTPQLAEACRQTLTGRLRHGGGHTGWSRSWIINFYARLQDGGEAYRHLQELFRKSVYPNLFDMHPPFQIDGNFGALSGVAEMLVQSRISEVTGSAADLGSFDIDLLPALPSGWQNGSMRGLRARGACVVELDWDAGKLIAATVRAEKGGTFNIRYADYLETVELQSGESREFKPAL